MCKSIGRGPSWGGGGWYASADGVTGAHGVISAQWAKDANGKLVQSDILPQMKQALGVLRDWYAAGVIPVDFFTVDDSNAMTVVGGNQAGLVYRPAWGAHTRCKTASRTIPRPSGPGRRSPPSAAASAATWASCPTSSSTASAAASPT